MFSGNCDHCSTQRDGSAWPPSYFSRRMYLSLSGWKAVAAFVGAKVPVNGSVLVRASETTPGPGCAVSPASQDPGSVGTKAF